LSRVLVSPLKPGKKRRGRKREDGGERHRISLRGISYKVMAFSIPWQCPLLLLVSVRMFGENVKPSQMKNVRWWDVDWCSKARGRQFAF